MQADTGALLVNVESIALFNLILCAAVWSVRQMDSENASKTFATDKLSRASRATSMLTLCPENLMELAQVCTCHSSAALFLYIRQ